MFKRGDIEDGSEDQQYIPALGYQFLTPLYDPLLRLSLREKEWRPAVAAQLAVDTGGVLDLGCGTGTLTVEMARRYSTASRLQRSSYYHIQLLDGSETTTENIEGKLPIFLKQSGLVDVRNTGYTKTSFGRIRTYRGVKPESA